ncbi:DUF2164 domain-containing protein [Paenibacillus albiflavus]|uniref:DUF2164 domain-containing protein n=1 Tax=Paenibacillus albiflavus TaxID=2545760 RepID=A0A4R4E941_9BACL|nr:DUF2164 domain-containing protein [Paenibacillus albiflavus]TCZ74305.1 DUF2164 domain-containing protein [Paenibacillus albiflavus]
MNPIKLPREQKMEIISSIQDYFEAERSESIGDLAAENLLDFMLKELSPYIYNQAITDARKVIMQKMESLDDEMYALEKPLQANRR